MKHPVHRANRFAEGQVRRVLEEVGVEILDERGDELFALCPGHELVTGHRDRRPSWSINSETGQHFDFGCGYKGNLFTLVVDLEGLEAAEALVPRDKQHGRPAPPPRGWRPSPLPSTRPTANREVEHPTVSEIALERYPDAPPQWALEERRLTIGTADRFGLRWDSSHDAWVLPIRFPDGRLLGWQIKSQRGAPYVRNMPPKMRKASTLFGIDVADSDRPVVVVESPLDAAMLHGIGYGAVALCGSKVSVDQMSLLQHFPAVTFALDNDGPGLVEMNRLGRSLLGVRARFVEYRDGDPKDVGEMDEESIAALLPGV